MSTVLKFKCFKRRASLLNMGHHKELRDALSFSHPGARFVPGYTLWLQQKKLGVPEEERSGWDGKTHMVDNGLLSVGLLLGVKEELKKKGFDIQIKDWQKRPHIFPKKGFIEEDPQYNYQNDCTEKMLKAIPDGGGLVLSATGSGKTKMAAQFFSWIPGKCIFVVDQRELLYQSQKEVLDWLSRKGYDTKVGIVGDSEFKPERVTIATIQTLQKHKNRKDFKDWFKDIDIVLIDEIHVQMGRRNFNVVTSINPVAVFGLTATMELKKKNVRFKCFSICGPTVFEFPMVKGVEAGVLTKGAVCQISVPANKKEPKLVRIKGKDDKRPANDYEHQVIFNDTLNILACNLVGQALGKDYAVVVLVERIRHLKKLAKLLDAHNPQLCYGAISLDDRKTTLKKFDQGKHSLIIANKVFTKGINLKRIDLIIDLAQRKNKNDCLQKYGRGVRLHAEKDGLLYISMFTDIFGDKARASQKTAFKRAKIPLKQFPLALLGFGIKSMFSQCEKFLQEILKPKKQMSLF
jgi:superfamily II DNA or RNA helicase